MLTTSGMAMEVHYCMGKRVGIDFFAHHNDKCGKCGMKEKGGCCKDEQKFYKLSQDHSSTTLAVALIAPVKDIIIDRVIFLPLSISSLPANNKKYEPDILSGYGLCKLHCVFRL